VTVLSLERVGKSFSGVEAVRGVSFTVEEGELFGVLGPNGAGKTTAIRMILDILRPDSGEIAVLGGPMDEAKKDRIGYLPEERGLYGNLKVLDCLVYLATLKGLSKKEARKRASEYLERVGLSEAADRKIKELSRGMHQKAQFGAAMVHDPELLIIDEPFAGLDPVNTRLLKELLLEMRREGKTILMSEHQMQLVEELCDRLVMFSGGEIVLSGTPQEVKERFAPNAVLVEGEGDFEDVPGVEEISSHNSSTRLELSNETTPQEILRNLASRPGVSITRFERALPSLDEVFVRVAGRNE
jgi:ABC-2 type transport system ATP-binding protein